MASQARPWSRRARGRQAREHCCGVRQLSAELLGEVAEQAFRLAEELLAELDQRPAGLVPQGELLAGVVGAGVAGGALERCWELWVGERLSGDAVGVQGVGLALVATAAPLGGAVGADIADVMAGVAQVGRGVPAKAAGTLDAPAGDRTEAGRPRLQGAMPLARDVEVRLCHPPAPAVQDRRGQGALVWVDPDDVAVRVARDGRCLAGHGAPLASGKLLGAGRQIPVEGADAPIKSGRYRKARTGVDTSVVSRHQQAVEILC